MALSFRIFQLCGPKPTLWAQAHKVLILFYIKWLYEPVYKISLTRFQKNEKYLSCVYESMRTHVPRAAAI